LAMAATLSEERHTVPSYAYPIKILALPVTLIGDIFYWPYALVRSGGQWP
jgi:hypothetical protein